MPIFLILALGASVALIAMRAAEAAETGCPDEAMRNLVLTGVAVFKQRVDGVQRVSPQAEAQAKVMSEKCQRQLIDFLKRNPATALELKKAQQSFLQHEALLRSKTVSIPETEEQRLIRRRDELFRKLAK